MSENPLVPGPPPATTPAPARPSRPWLVPAIIGVVALLFVCCAGFAATGFFVLRSQSDFTIIGDITLSERGNAEKGYGAAGTSCRGMSGFDDINEGTEVVVSDADGKTLAVGRLRAGEVKGGDCVFPFIVSHVPKNKQFYGVTISHRGTLIYTQQDVMQPLHLVL